MAPFLGQFLVLEQERLPRLAQMPLHVRGQQAEQDGEPGRGPRLILIGGELRRLSQTMVGPLTRLTLQELHLDKAFMGTIGVVLALAGPWLLPTFVLATDPAATQVLELGVVLLWIAAGYQLFDGLNMGAGFALRGAGDVRVPAVLFLVLSWGVFVPLSHSLSFAPGQGWVDVLPQFGMGAVGGWIGLLVYVVLLGSALYLRWRSGHWRKMKI